MPATNAVPRSTSRSLHDLDMRRSIFLLTSFFLAAILICGAAGCGSSRSEGSDQPDSTVATDAAPDLTDDDIRERINFAYVRNVPEESGNGQPINWTFAFEEPKEISIVDKQVDGGHATVVLDIKTGTGPRAREPRQLVGQVRSEWVLRTGWVLRKWEITGIENISMKYKNLPKPANQNTSR